MARTKKEDIKEESENEKVLTPEKQLKAHLKANEGYHYNSEEQKKPYKVSMSSLNADLITGGGLSPCIALVCGETESGKSSLTLSVMSNFLDDKTKRRRGVLILAEGRNPDIERTGIPFTENSETWVDGSCYILRTNIYEVALQIIRELVLNNPLNIEYFYVIDSIHAMIAKSESEKSFDDAARVGSAASLATHFLKTVTLPTIHNGHIGILILQKRSSIKINPYERGDPKIIDTSAAHSLLHFATWIFELGHRWNDDYFLEDKNDKKSKRIGHNCIVTIKKSPNETTGTSFKIPIVYKRKNNKSVWIEKEIFDMMLVWSSIKREGSQGSFILSEDILKEIREIDPECPDKFRTQEKTEEYLEANPKVTDYLFGRFRKMLCS